VAAVASAATLAGSLSSDQTVMCVVTLPLEHLNIA
jgi:hypothetical protein